MFQNLSSINGSLLFFSLFFLFGEGGGGLEKWVSFLSQGVYRVISFGSILLTHLRGFASTPKEKSLTIH